MMFLIVSLCNLVFLLGFNLTYENSCSITFTILTTALDKATDNWVCYTRVNSREQSVHQVSVDGGHA